MKKLGILTTIFAVIFLAGCSSNNSYQTENFPPSYEEENIISRDEAISEYWDEIKDYLDGTETIEACTDSGCYDLDADISSGHLDTLHFNNGGYLNFYTEFDNDGSAYDSDDEGNSWDFSLDMDSSLVDDAVQEWADMNGYELE